MKANPETIVVKAPCKVVSKSPIELYGVKEIDGVVLEPGDRVLVAGQSDRISNGIFVCAERTWIRAPDFAQGSALTSRIAVPVIRPDGSYDIFGMNATDRPLVIGDAEIRFVQGAAQRRSDIGGAANTDQNTRTLSVVDFGAKGDGVTDDSAAFQAAVDSIPVNGGTIHVPGTPFGYGLRKTITIKDKAGLRMVGESSQGGVKGVGLIWNGDADATVLLLDRTRDSYFSDFSIVPGKARIGVGVRIDNITRPREHFNSTNNVFERIAIGASMIGILIGDQSTSNNDLHTFRDVTIDGAGASGFVIANGQSKWIRISGGSIATRRVGIDQRAGSFVSDKVNYSHNGTDHLLGAVTDVITIRSAQSESAEKFVDDNGASGASWAIIVEGCRVSPLGVGPDNIIFRYRKRGPLSMIANDFSGGEHRPSIRFQIWGSGPGASAFIAGNVFPNGQPIDTAPGRCSLVLTANNFISHGGQQGPMDASPAIELATAVPDLDGPQGRIWRLSATTDASIEGIAGGWDGREIVLINVGPVQVTLVHRSSRSKAIHRIMCPAGADFRLKSDASVRLIYDDLAHVWRFA